MRSSDIAGGDCGAVRLTERVCERGYYIFFLAISLLPWKLIIVELIIVVGD